MVDLLVAAVLILDLCYESMICKCLRWAVVNICFAKYIGSNGP